MFKSFKISVLIIISSFIANAQSQNFKFKHFSTEMGLSSSEVYCQVQDSLGYMWFGTSRGLSKFDGYTFENFSAKDGLSSNSIIKMFYDRFGRIWFSTFDGSLSYLQDKKFYSFPYNDSIQKIDKNYYITNLFFDKDSNMWFTPAMGGIYYFDTKGVLHNQTPTSKYSAFYFREIGGNYLTAYIAGQNPDSVYFKQTDTCSFLFATKNGLRTNFAVISKNEYLISLSNTLYYIKNGKIEKQIKYENEISGVFVDNASNLWISVLYEGVYVYYDFNFENSQIILREMTPTVVLQDKQNGYWLPTTENAIFYTPSFQFNYFYIPSLSILNIQALKVFNNNLYISNYNRQLFKIKIGKNFIYDAVSFEIKKDRNYGIYDIAVTDDNIVWFLGKELIKVKNNKATVVSPISRCYKAFAKGNKLYISSDNDLKIVSDTSFEVLPHNLNLIVNALYVDDADNVWLGTINGLYVYSKKMFQFFGGINKVLKFRINDIAGYGKYIVVGTNGSGVYFFNPASNYLKVITENEGLNSNFVNVVYSKDNSIWVGTNKGLCKINVIEKNDSLHIFATQFSENDGLLATEIKDIDEFNNLMFVGTSDGLYYFNVNKIIKKSNAPLLHFDSILVNNKRVTLDTAYKLSSSRNTITFYFKAISFAAGNRIIYKYKLNGYDNQWNTTRDLFLRFPNLQPGKYTLLLYASADGINWNSNPLKVSFFIRKKFTQTLFFYLLIIVLLFGIGLTFLSYRYHRLRQDIRMRRLTIKSEQKALRSQMNPHFIFNALNSIRRYIMENKTDKADFYLTSFANLMRRVLENSKYENITLDEELNTLKLYLELERMRFDDTFVFNIVIDEKIKTQSITLPTMIIQPVIENAIWHGLAPLQKNGVLTITLKLIDEKSFSCTVDDNGIGRKKAMEIAEKRKGHKSLGIQNLQERISLINLTGFKHIEITTLDKYDEKDNPAGTTVIINFRQVDVSQDVKTNTLEKLLIKFRFLKK